MPSSRKNIVLITLLIVVFLVGLTATILYPRIFKSLNPIETENLNPQDQNAQVAVDNKEIVIGSLTNISENKITIINGGSTSEVEIPNEVSLLCYDGEISNQTVLDLNKVTTTYTLTSSELVDKLPTNEPVAIFGGYLPDLTYVYHTVAIKSESCPNMKEE